MRLIRLGIAVTAATSLALTGCSGSTSGTRVSASSGPSASGTGGFPSTASAPTPTSSGGSASTAGSESGTGSLQAGLLVAADVKGFMTATSSTTSDPLPCTPNDPPAVDQVPPTQKAISTLESDTKQSAFTEDLYSFPDAATAARFVAVGTKGLACSTASLGGTKARIVGPVSPKITVRTDENVAWDVALTSGQYATLSLTRIGSTIVALAAQASSTGRTEIVPAELIQLAVEKYLANR